MSELTWKDEILDAGKVGDFTDLKINAKFDPALLEGFIDRELVTTFAWQKNLMKELMDYPPQVTIKELFKWHDEYRHGAVMPVPPANPEEQVAILREEVQKLSRKLAYAEDELLRKGMFINSQVHYTPAVNGLLLEMFARMRVLAEGGTIGKFELETLVAKIESELSDDKTETTTIERLRRILLATEEES